MKRCNSCLMPDTRPDTEFVNGKCSACIAHENRPKIDWEARKKDLERLLDRFNGECIVPSSGGKDSTAQVVKMLELGAHVTVVTARTCMLTQIGRQNIDNLARLAPTIEVVPCMIERRELNRLGLELVGDISLPEHWAIFSTPFRMAVALNKKLIMYGENPQNAYGGPLTELSAKIMTRRWTQEFGGFLGLRPSDITNMDMTYYSLPSEKDLDGIEAHFLGAYLPWNSHSNYQTAWAHGFRTLHGPPGPANWWEFENLDNAQTGIHDYFMWLKYGYGRACAQLSVDIRLGMISRKEAMQILEKCDGVFPNEYCQVFFDEVLSHIGLTQKRFNQLVEQFKGDVCLQHA